MEELKIKICGVNDPENILQLSVLRIDFLGFIFYPGSKRYIGESPDPLIFDTVPAGISKTGVFVDTSITSVLSAVRRFRLDLVQLHGNESPEYCRILKESGIKVIKSFAINMENDFLTAEKYSDACDLFLFDSGIGDKGGSGKKYSWTILGNYLLNKPFFLSGGIGPRDADQIRRLNYNFLTGLDINSKFEIRPGVKDINKIKKFLRDIKS